MSSSKAKVKVTENSYDIGRLLVPSLRDYCDHLRAQKPEGDRPLEIGDLRIDWLPAHYGFELRPMARSDDAIYLFLRPAEGHPTSEPGFFRCSITDVVDPTRSEQWVEVVYSRYNNNLPLFRRLLQLYYDWLVEVTGTDDFIDFVQVELLERLG